MNDGSSTVQRTLHFKFTIAGADTSHLFVMLKSLAPFYEVFGGVRIRLLQNVDDPTRYTQVIEYETHETIEQNRQQVASDPRVQAYLQAWRMMLPGVVDLEVFREVGG